MFSTFYSRKKHFRIVCEIFSTACEFFCIASKLHPQTVRVTPRHSASSLSSLRHPKAVSVTLKYCHLFKNPQLGKKCQKKYLSLKCMTDKQMDRIGKRSKSQLWTCSSIFSISYSRKKQFRIVCEIFRTAREIFCISLTQSPPESAHPMIVRVTPKLSSSPWSSLRHSYAVSITFLKIHSIIKKKPKKVFSLKCMMDKQTSRQGNGPNNWLRTCFVMFLLSYSRKKHFCIVCEIFRTACEIFRIASQRHPQTVRIYPKQSMSPLSCLHHP